MRHLITLTVVIVALACLSVLALPVPTVGHAHQQENHGSPDSAQDCAVDHPDHGQEHGCGANDRITFPEELQRRLNFATQPVRRERFAERIEVPGTVREIPGARARLVAPANGVVTAPESWPRPGQPVTGGDTLMRLTLLPDSGTASGLALEVARARERLSVAEANLTRLRTLAEEGVIAENRVLDARRERNIARAELDDAHQRQGRIGGSADPGAVPLHAPGTGRLEALHVTPGEVVQAGQHLATVLDGTSLWLVAHLYPADLQRVTTLADPMVRRPGQSDWHAVAGAPVWKAGEFQDPGQTLPIAFAVDSGVQAYRPGMPVVLAFDTELPQDRTTIPMQALIDDDGVTIVLVQTGSESFERRSVRTGIRASGRVEVLAGLEAGERVVTEGAYAVLLAGRDSGAVDHGHAH